LYGCWEPYGDVCDRCRLLYWNAIKLVSFTLVWNLIYDVQRRIPSINDVYVSRLASLLFSMTLCMLRKVRHQVFITRLFPVVFRDLSFERSCAPNVNYMWTYRKWNIDINGPLLYFGKMRCICFIHARRNYAEKQHLIYLFKYVYLCIYAIFLKIF